MFVVTLNKYHIFHAYNSNLLSRYFTRFCCFLVLLCTGSVTAQAQGFISDVADFFEFNVGPEREDTTFRHAKFVLAPITSYEPSTSWGFGIGAKFLFKPFGAGAETRTSNLPISVQYTLRNQFIAWSEYNVFFPEEKFLLKGNLGFSKFPIGYFGIGSNTRESDKIDISFNNFLLEPLLLRRLRPGLFVGGGWRLNSFKNLEFVEEENTPLPEEDSLLDTLTSFSSGLELATTLDTRDNILNATSGSFLEFTHGFYNETFGSSHEFMLTKLDYRKYVRTSQSRPHDVLAFQFFTRVAGADTPPLELSTLGGPELLRGFRESRFRDRISLFGQVEYRRQVTENIGFVAFTGLGEVAQTFKEVSFGELKYSVGTGIRFKIVKSENLNIRIDYAFGLGRIRENNFYLGIAEAF